jgi:phenylalanine-4-hydroxylase
MGNDFRNQFECDANGYYLNAKSIALRQEYSQYSEEDHQVWQILYERQMPNLPDKATVAYLDAVKAIGFEAQAVPRFDVINEVLGRATGWAIHVVPGLIPARDFFELLVEKKFCATTWLRKMHELDYLEEPDMFHDVFGHVPLLTNQALCDFVVKLSELALKHFDNQTVVDALARLYWFTIEFGLIQEKDGLRIYGAGILSSRGETDYSLQDAHPQRLPYNPRVIMQTSFIKERYQEQYFVIDSYEQLYQSIGEIETYIEEIISKENEAVLVA